MILSEPRRPEVTNTPRLQRRKVSFTLPALPLPPVGCSIARRPRLSRGSCCRFVVMRRIAAEYFCPGIVKPNNCACTHFSCVRTYVSHPRRCFQHCPRTPTKNDHIVDRRTSFGVPPVSRDVALVRGLRTPRLHKKVWCRSSPPTSALVPHLVRVLGSTAISGQNAVWSVAEYTKRYARIFAECEDNGEDVSLQHKLAMAIQGRVGWPHCTRRHHTWLFAARKSGVPLRQCDASATCQAFWLLYGGGGASC